MEIWIIYILSILIFAIFVILCLSYSPPCSFIILFLDLWFGRLYFQYRHNGSGRLSKSSDLILYEWVVEVLQSWKHTILEK